MAAQIVGEDEEAVAEANECRKDQDRHSKLTKFVSGNILCFIGLIAFLPVQRHLLFNFGNRQTWVQALGACFCAIHNSVAAIDGKWVLEGLAAFKAEIVTRVNHPAVCLHEDGRAEIFVAVPPVAWACG